MAVFNITNKRSDSDTVTPLPANAFRVSTLEANKCSSPLLYRDVDTLAYHDGGLAPLAINDVVYTDEALTMKKNTTGSSKDYNINDAIFITLNSDSMYINSNCK